MSFALPLESVLTVLKLDEKINSVMYLLACASEACFTPASDASWVAKASCIHQLGLAVEATRQELNLVTTDVCDAPLRNSIASVRMWVDNIRALSKRMEDAVVSGCTQVVSEASRSVDALAPRWGENVNDAELRDDGARLQLAVNPSMRELPEACRRLHRALGDLAKVADALCSDSPPDLWPLSREAVREGRNSLAFGKLTVNVSAGIKVLFQTPVQQGPVKAILQYKSTLPLSLVRRLEGLLDPPPAVGQPGGAASSGSGAGDSMPPPSAASTPPAKRGRPPTGLLGGRLPKHPRRTT